MKILTKIYMALMPKNLLNELNKTYADRIIKSLKISGVNLSGMQKVKIYNQFNLTKEELKKICSKK